MTSAIASLVCERLATRGDRLFLVGRNEAKLAALERRLAEVSDSGDAPIAGRLAADLDDLEGNADRVQAGIDALGGLDIVLVAHGELGSQLATEHDYRSAEAIFRTNFLSPVSLLVPIANFFEAQGHGRIMVVSSVAGERGRPRNYTYGSAKGALTLYLQGLRSRLWSRGIEIHTIKLGPVVTPMTHDHPKNRLFAEAPEVADQLVALLGRRGGEHYVPRYWRPIMAIVRLLPEPLFQRFSFLAGR